VVIGVHVSFALTFLVNHSTSRSQRVDCWVRHEDAPELGQPSHHGRKRSGPRTSDVADHLTRLTDGERLAVELHMRDGNASGAERSIV
jgi:hypothetical protein